MGCVQAVHEDSVAVVEKFGRYDHIAKPGPVVLPVPGIWTISGTLSTRVQQIDVRVETKTKDNVFVRVTIAVQFEVIDDEKAQYDAFYKLSRPAHQIQSYVEDVVRASVPTLDLDNVFLEKKHVAQHVFDQLEKEMQSYGYKILSALVTNIEPDDTVKASMNEINASRRLRIAQTEQAEAQKYTSIRHAEALSEATYLQGEGLARQRKAIIDGMRSSVEEFQHGLEGHVSSKEVMDLLLITQYFDTVKDLSQGKKSNIVYLPKKKGPKQEK